MPLIKLCKLNELTEVDSRGFVISEFSPERNIFIVRNYDEVVAYENSCPHNHAPLDWAPDVFLSEDKDYIQCSSHGALFEINNGECIYGPCTGDSLTPIEVIIFDETIHVEM